MCLCSLPFFFFFNDTATTEIYTLSLHDALPISSNFKCCLPLDLANAIEYTLNQKRSEEHTSELQSHHDIVCRLLLEKKKSNKIRLKWVKRNFNLESEIMKIETC